MSGEVMQDCQNTSSVSSEDNVMADVYRAPRLLDYGPVSELTQAVTGDTGDDGAMTPSSYTAST
jgi:hypothetical protein